ncbi:MAG: flagellar export chaperone FliS [Betaproteobacteria bacterium]|nr:flagellar export chaperone FliS [Betaproteobacteria bacterium]
MRAASAYKRVSDSTSVMAADPIGLIVLLYEKLLQRLREAALAIDSGDFSARGRATSSAIEIISSGLIGALDLERGGELALRLKEQYQLWLRMLLQVNLQGDKNLLAVLESNVAEVLSAWQELKASKTG